MIDYVKRNDIFGDFRRNLSNSEIARIRGVSRTTVVGLRKLYNATVADKEHPEAVKRFTGGEKKPSGDRSAIHINHSQSPVYGNRQDVITRQFCKNNRVKVLCYKFRLITFRKKITDNLN